MKPNGTVMGWSRNTSGEAAIGNNQNQLLPINVSELSTVKEIIAGSNGSASFYAIKHDGRVYARGNNGYGQLGIGNTVYQASLLKIFLNSLL
jgi:alpha-tubulin suppressor-like RCC1 family protein